MTKIPVTLTLTDVDERGGIEGQVDQHESEMRERHRRLRPRTSTPISLDLVGREGNFIYDSDVIGGFGLRRLRGIRSTGAEVRQEEAQEALRRPRRDTVRVHPRQRRRRHGRVRRRDEDLQRNALIRGRRSCASSAPLELFRRRAARSTCPIGTSRSAAAAASPSPTARAGAWILAPGPTSFIGRALRPAALSGVCDYLRPRRRTRPSRLANDKPRRPAEPARRGCVSLAFRA